MKKRILCLLIIWIMCTSIVAGCGKKASYILQEENIISTDLQVQQETVNPENPQEESSSLFMIYVDVCGAVRYPGVYSLKEGARVFEAIDAAGGLLEDACLEAINRAEILSDGQKLYIMNVQEWQIAQKEQESAEKEEKDDGLININTASESQLCTLPGIGQTRARAIIAYREEAGGFSAIEEITNVSGIKSGTYEKMKNLIKVQD